MEDDYLGKISLSDHGRLGRELTSVRGLLRKLKELIPEASKEYKAMHKCETAAGELRALFVDYLRARKEREHPDS